MTDKNTLNASEIDDLLARAGEAQALPSAGLLARITADADLVADGRDVPVAAKPKMRRPGFLARILAALGGWPAMAGLTTATVAGIWIGYVSPDTLNDLADGYLTLGTSDVLGDFMPAFTDILDEG